MNRLKPQPWQIFHARFNFEEGHGYKFRPVIVLGVNANEMIVTMVTSSTNKLNLQHDYLIRDWQICGLEKPFIARLDRIVELPPEYLGTSGYIETLSEFDINQIKEILEKIIRKHSS